MTLLKPVRVQNLWQSFAFAGAGFRKALSGERNLRLHLLIAVGVLVVGYNCGIGQGQWAVLILTIGMMLAVELLNTAIEHLGEAVTQGAYVEMVRSAKDISAAACMLVAIMAVVVGGLVFAPHLDDAFAPRISQTANAGPG